MVFFIAAAYGYDPFDPMRPAELLVIRDLYPDPHAARLAKMVGKRAVKRMGARLIPGLAIAFNAIGNERDTRALADRAIAFYGG
jgi:hypothetical protein